MKLTKIAKVESGQDIAIYGGYLFDFVAHGKCLGEVSIYEMSTLLTAGGNEPDPVCRIILDGVDRIIPHANAVFFGNEYYEEGDEFPLLYANVYNNYAKAENRREGMLLVYRIWREGNCFHSKFVQTITVGFVEDREQWKSCEGDGDIRPYGNFIADVEKNILYAFVMRDKPNSTRYFAFDLPKVSEGEFDEEMGVPNRILSLSEVKESFDTDYHKIIQGACVHNGIIYSIEGGSLKSPAAIRIIRPEDKRLSLYQCFFDLGIIGEPEGIEFYDGVCYLVVGGGDTYIIEFG